jgi:multidrug efflux pump subunit AcrA (membrane-fusion protein)
MQPRVFRLDGSELVEVPVELGLSDGKFTEIKCDALNAGDAVVVEQINRRGVAGTPRQRMPRM